MKKYTKRPAIAETRILNVSDRWIVFRFKDYAEGGKSSVKKMGLFTFIKYLIQHIPDKYFRWVRGYGLFSNRIKKTTSESIENTREKKTA